MEVKVHRTSIIAAPPPGVEPEPSPLPLTIFDRFAPNIHIAVLFAFSPPTPTNSEIIKALSKTLLLHFPALTARLGGTARNPCLILGGRDGGALVVEAEVDSSLDEHMPLRPSPELTLLHPSTTDASRLLQVQLNRFSCGGLIIGITSHHRVADGQSINNFFIAWGKISRGVTAEPVPNHGRSWLKPRCPAECEFQHWGTEFVAIPPHSEFEFYPKKSDLSRDSTCSVLLHYSGEYINSKRKAGLKGKLTTFQVLVGHLWRKITIARALKQEETTMIKISVNGRPRLRPAVPNEFFGNLVLDANPSAEAGELVEGGLVRAAKIV